MSLKLNIYREICSKLFDPLYQENVWRILVLDEYSTKITSNILKMHDLFEKGITLVDDLNKKRQPVPLEAIYLISPQQSKIELMLRDFVSTPVYSRAHVFFIDECSSEHLTLIAESVAANYISTLKEINLKFLIIESQLFHLDFQLDEDEFTSFNDLDDELAWELARAITSLCDILSENPSIYYQTTEMAQRFAIKVQQEMFKSETENGYVGHTMHKDRSVLLILDRSFDPLTPLLHDLHLQCLAYDLLEIENNTYQYKNFEVDKLISVDLSENDDLWVQLRHIHIADVSRILPVKLKQLASAQKCIDNTVNGPENIKTIDVGSDKASNKDMVRKQLQIMVKKMPHLRQEAASVGNMFYLSEACLSAFQSGVNQLCECEQNLAMGTDASGNSIKNPDKLVINVINNTMATISEKIRLLLTLIITQSGMLESTVADLVEKLRIDERCIDILKGIGKLGSFILNKDNSSLKLSGLKQFPFLIKNRKNILNGSSYTLSRWIPFIEDLIADVIRGNFNNGLISKLEQPRTNPDYLKPDLNGYVLPQRQSWAKLNEVENHTGPRLIIFIIGGVSLAESRVAYNYTKLCHSMRSGNIPDQLKKNINFPTENAGGRGWNWEVLIGGTSILTPEKYLNFLSKTKTMMI